MVVTVSLTTTVSPLGRVVVWLVTRVRCLALIMDRLLSATSALSSAASSSLWNLRTRVRFVEDTDSCAAAKRERERVRTLHGGSEIIRLIMLVSSTNLFVV